jgi:hypothetical protein
MLREFWVLLHRHARVALPAPAPPSSPEEGGRVQAHAPPALASLRSCCLGKEEAWKEMESICIYSYYVKTGMQRFAVICIKYIYYI